MKKTPTKAGLYVNPLINGEVYFLDVNTDHRTGKKTYRWYWSIQNGTSLLIPESELEFITPYLIKVWTYNTLPVKVRWIRYRLRKRIQRK